MTFLGPEYLIGALLVAAGVVLLHFIVTRQPRSSVFPTARFVPDLPAKATSRATRPSDLLLMLLRVATVILAGAGLARPLVQPSRAPAGRVILADVSRGVANAKEVADSVRHLADAHSVILVFDSTARRVTSDSTAPLSLTGGRGSLSAALIAGLRAASDLRDRVDSVELVIVSSFLAEETDAATNEIRALWPGRARLVQVAAADVSPVAGSAPSGIVVSWPMTERPRFAVPRAKSDSVGAVVSTSATVIADFTRRWTYPADSIRGASVVARWVDGEPAAIEKPEGTSCIRSASIPVTPVGDFAIRPEVTRLMRDLRGPCGEPISVARMDASSLTALRGRAALAPATAFQARSDVPSTLAPWLLALALLGALAEVFVRNRGKASLDADVDSRAGSEAKAA